MIIKRPAKSVSERLRGVLAKEPGLSVKDLAARLGINRQFMAGFLAALEERGEVSSRSVGPARIYFKQRAGTETFRREHTR